MRSTPCKFSFSNKRYCRLHTHTVGHVLLTNISQSNLNIAWASNIYSQNINIVSYRYLLSLSLSLSQLVSLIFINLLCYQNITSMNNYGDRDNKGGCYFHPTEVVIGVCHMCLHERLTVLASKQTHHSNRPKSRTNVIRNHSFSHDQNPPANVTTLPKIFAIGSLLNRFEFRNRKSDDHYYSDDASSSHEGWSLYF